MTEIVRQMAGDLREMRRLMERQAERTDFAKIVAGLVARGVITRADADRAMGKIEERKGG